LKSGPKNARSRKVKIIQELLLLVLLYPPYPPDFAPTDLRREFHYEFVQKFFTTKYVFLILFR
jgi:hypothetical protein